ncbi:hypothetical protein HDU87_002207 [Geranomyces variabilis]|uniref:Uncharacterized protein n=1 Tax=Geranomyces variabilis TaxID=109894 RepID=A0AAD5XIT6_9FUNG|nr:hypothetical protein HDU87_002207 [Geranomyces variabilis]
MDVRQALDFGLSGAIIVCKVPRKFRGADVEIFSKVVGSFVEDWERIMGDIEKVLQGKSSGMAVTR